MDAVLLAEKVDAVLYAVVAGEMLGDGPVWAVSDEHEPGGTGAGYTREDLHDVGDPLDGAEVREMDEQAFVGACEAGAVRG